MDPGRSKGIAGAEIIAGFHRSVKATSRADGSFEILGLGAADVRRGFANKQIGDALAIREDTVKKHLRNAFTKLGVHRRTQIISSTARLVTG